MYCTKANCPYKACPKHMANLNPRHKHPSFYNLEGTNNCPHHRKETEKCLKQATKER